MPQHIGIVACSAEGAALCYRTICTEGAQLLGAHAHPEVSMHTPSLAETMACIHRNDWQGVGEIILASARKLAAIGADFLICPDNTLHQALPYVQPRSPLPWLHIAEVVADAAVAQGFRCLGLTGTRWLVESEVYPEVLSARGLRYLRPDASERGEINRIIMDELVCGVFKPEAIASLQRVIGRLQQAGCDAVVLGCTELPLIMNDANSPLPTLDSTRLLARAALRAAVQGVAGNGQGAATGTEVARVNPMVREMRANDRAAWAAMRGALWPDETPQAHVDMIDRLLESGDAWNFIAEAPDGRPVGFAEVAVRQYANGCETRPVPFLEGIWVKEQFRRRGVGGRLIEHAEALLLAHGHRELGSDTELHNRASQAAHRAWGFSETERVMYFRKPLTMPVCPG
jgi:aspartate racemase